MTTPSPPKKPEESHRLRLMRLGLPTMLFVIVLGFELLEHVLISHESLDLSFLVETLLFGLSGPVIMYLALGWLQQLYLERAQAAQMLQRLHDELLQRDAERRRLLRQIMTAQEEERRRLVHHLHDEFAQGLIAFQLNLDAIRPYLKDAPDALLQEIEDAHRLAEDMLHRTRQLMLDLRPSPLDELGLVPALRDLAARILEPHGVRVQFTRHGRPAPLDEGLKTVLYRLGQECLMNILKHAQATEVQVTVAYQPDRVRMEIRDNGRGFDPKHLSAPNERGGWGLLGMRERCGLLGGSMQITSAPNQGTTVRLEIPLPTKADD